jgi:hypothetical protein
MAEVAALRSPFDKTPLAGETNLVERDFPRRFHRTGK